MNVSGPISLKAQPDIENSPVFKAIQDGMELNREDLWVDGITVRRLPSGGYEADDADRTQYATLADFFKAYMAGQILPDDVR